MAIRMAQELGLHREQSCLDTGPESHAEQDFGGEASKSRIQPKDIGLIAFDESAKVTLFCAAELAEIQITAVIECQASSVPISAYQKYLARP